MQARKGRGVGQGHHVFFEKLPKAGRGWATRDSHLPDAKQDSMRREGRHLDQSPAGKSKRRPPEGLGHHHGHRGRDRVTESPHNLGLPWCPCSLPELGPKEDGVLGAE